MSVYDWIVIGSWAVFLIVWGASALRAKRTIQRGGRISSQVGLRLLIVAVAAMLINANVNLTWDFLAPSVRVVLDPLGAALAVAGVGFACWARYHLGRNWGMPMSVKEGPELVTSGPYAQVRHPIYTGVLLAALGSALATSPIWFAIFAVIGANFWYAAKQEEKLMLTQFPATYAPYVARTKRFIPFVF